MQKIAWDKQAALQLVDAIKYIKKDSPQNAQKVKQDILLKIKSLPDNPEANPPDKYKLNNDNSFRAFELQHYRISYLITEKLIIIVRIRHTKMNPKMY